MAINTEWHQENLITSNASLAERVDWHAAHAEACSCRPIPFDVQNFFNKTVEEA